MKTSLPVRRRLVRRLAVFLAVAGAALVQSGCVAVAAAGAAGTGVAWYSGRLDSTLNVSIDRAYEGTQRAIKEMQFAQVSSTKSGVDAHVIARTALDKKIDIKLERAGDAVTRISIRVGVFGDETLSLTILEKIKANI